MRHERQILYNCHLQMNAGGSQCTPCDSSLGPIPQLEFLIGQALLQSHPPNLLLYSESRIQAAMNFPHLIGSFDSCTKPQYTPCLILTFASARAPLHPLSIVFSLTALSLPLSLFLSLLSPVVHHCHHKMKLCTCLLLTSETPPYNQQ